MVRKESEPRGIEHDGEDEDEDDRTRLAMTLPRSLRVSVLVMAGSGITALGLALGSVAWLLIGLGGFTACVVLTALRPSWRLRRGLATLAMLAAVQGVVAEIVSSGAFLVPAGHFLILAQLVFLSQERSNRHYGLICVLTFVQMMLAGVLSVDLAFGLCFLLYLPAGVAALLLLNLSGELERSGPLAPEHSRGSPRGPRVGALCHTLRRRLLATVALVTAAELALTIAVFIHFPRFGLQFFQLPPVQKGPVLTGFSDRIRFGELGRVLENAQVVMSIRILEGGRVTNGAALPLRWRATAHDTYEDATWSNRNYIKDTTYQPLNPDVGLRPFVRPCPGTEVVQEVTLEPVSTRMLFYLPHLLVLKTATPNLDAVFWHVPSRTASSPRSSSVSLRYVATSRVPSWSAERLRRPRALRDKEAEELQHCLQLPGSVTPRVRALAEEIVAGIPREAWYDRARAIEAYLKGRFEYSLNLWPTQAGVDPVEDFLFREQRGHCEHFASAMAVMLRCLGIPSRVATGFSGGEWNGFGQFYLVRQRNAHAWVEAYIPSVRDWEAFDPTPLGEALAPPPTGWLAGLDARLAHLRLVWNAYVVNYSSQEQRDLMNAATDLLSRISGAMPLLARDWFALRSGQGAPLGGIVVIVAGGAIVVGLLAVVRRLLRRRRAARRDGGAPGRPTVAFYRRLEAALRRHRLRRDPATTPLEFVRAAVASGGEQFAPAEAVVLAFYRVRFGGESLSKAELAEVACALAALEQRKR